MLQLPIVPDPQQLVQKLGIDVAGDVARALHEDVRGGDMTAGLIEPEVQAKARIICRDQAVICGKPWVEETLAVLVPDARTVWHIGEGGHCQPGDAILEISGQARALLTAERTMLNYLQLLSAVATRTAQFVALVAGTKAQIVDTRKTLPGLRLAEKYSVAMGGGVNHRIGLFDAVLLKENHISAAGSVTAALEKAARVAAKAEFVMIEVETLNQLEEALQAGAKFVLLDNMDYATIRQAVATNAGRAVLEVSGGVNISTVRAYAETGVDRISIGSLTKDITATDFSMRFVTGA